MGEQPAGQGLWPEQADSSHQLPWCQQPLCLDDVKGAASITVWIEKKDAHKGRDNGKKENLEVVPH